MKLIRFMIFLTFIIIFSTVLDSSIKRKKTIRKEKGFLVSRKNNRASINVNPLVNFRGARRSTFVKKYNPDEEKEADEWIHAFVSSMTNEPTFPNDEYRNNNKICFRYDCYKVGNKLGNGVHATVYEATKWDEKQEKNYEEKEEKKHDEESEKNNEEKEEIKNEGNQGRKGSKTRSIPKTKICFKNFYTAI